MFGSKHLSVNQWIIVFIILSIPIVNVIFILIWALSKNELTNIALQNFSKAIIKINIILFVIILAIIVGLGGSLPNINNSSVLYSPFNSILSGTSQIENNIQFDNVVFNSQFGITTVSGEVLNSNSTEHSFSILVSFYDENRKIIGTANGIVDNVGPGQTKTFQAISTENITNASNYHVNIDTLIY